MTRGSKFNVNINNITIDRLTLLKYKIMLDEYIKENNLWEENIRECWLFDLIDFKLKQDAGLCYRSIRVLEEHWGFDSNNDDIDDYIIKHMNEFMEKVNK